MDETNGRRETHDFMNVNVESFSQLPFIRRTPTKEKGSIFRLFGQELGGDNSENLSADSSETSTKNEENSENVKEKDKDNNNRRFECHYCFRNFPTSQALGGHQNAHKRERQHAKRGSMTSYFHHQQPHDTHHVYGFLNHHHRHYSSWTPEARFYGGGGGQQSPSYNYSRTFPPPSNPPTVNGSPLGMWRVPPSTSANSVQGVYSTSTASMFRTHEQETKDPNWPYRLRKPNVQEHVSLDLHL